MRYQFLQRLEGQFALCALCRVLQVSRSGYYAWRRRKPSQRAQQEVRLVEQIRSIHRDSDGTYGSPRVWRDLKEMGTACSQNRVARLMRKHGISAQPVRRFVVTTDSRHDLPVAQNLLGQDFSASEADIRWSGDITYIWTGEGWLYLSVVLDLFSRKVVGWSMQPTLERSLVVSALEMALQQRQPDAGLLCHSDRGSQYASADYQAVLADAGITCSMSRRGNCYDNAPVESFFASLKRELVHRYRFATREEAKTAVFRWIEVWYNRKRRHSALGYISPEAFERQSQQSQQPQLMAA